MRKPDVLDANHSAAFADNRAFRLWLARNAVLSSVFAGMLIAMAAMSGFAPSGINSAKVATSDAR
jgi:hypothetical protein